MKRQTSRWLAAACLLATALPSHALDYTFALDPGSLLLGSALSGSFAGGDTDLDDRIALSELVSFAVSYVGGAGSFTIAGVPSAFGFDPEAGQLTFAIEDASGHSVAANTYDGGSYAVLGVDGPDAGTGAMTITAVPEPGSWALLAAGLALVTATARRRRALSRRAG